MPQDANKRSRKKQLSKHYGKKKTATFKEGKEEGEGLERKWKYAKRTEVWKAI